VARRSKRRRRLSSTSTTTTTTTTTITINSNVTQTIQYHQWTKKEKPMFDVYFSATGRGSFFKTKSIC